MEKLISIISPAYNAEKYIGQYDDSIFKNRGENILSRIEVIVTDDCSKDNTLQTLEKYAQQYPITILRQEKNKGQAAARNKAMQQATGKYLWLVDIDDYILPNALEKAIAELDAHPQTDLLQFGFVRFHDGRADFKQEKCCGCPLSCENGQEAFVEIVKKGKYSAYPFQKIVSRKMIVQNNIFEKEGLIWDDTEWSPRTFAFAKHVRYLGENLLAQRRSSNSTSNTKRQTRRHYTDQIVVIESLNKFMDENKVSDEFRHALYSTLIGPLLNVLAGVVLSDGSFDEDLLAQFKKYEYIMDYGSFKRKYIYRPFIKLFGLKAFCKFRK